MTRTAPLTVVLLSLVASSFVVAAPANPDPLAQVDEAKAAYEKGEYNETLRLIGRLLSLKGKAAEGLDRYELLMLRAESHLKLKATTNAVSALEEAAKVAKAAEDEKGAATARALTILIKRSKNLQFTPKLVVDKKDKDGKRPSRDPIDITDEKQREQALDALYAEEKAAVRPKVVAAEKARVLPPVATALKAVGELKDLEIAATGKQADTKQETQDLVDHAHKLMAKGLDTMTARTERIAERANELVQYTVERLGGGYETRTKRAGIDRDDAEVLKGIISDCKKVVEACKELTQGFTDDIEPFEDLEDIARQTGERANDVLNDNYARTRS